MERRAIFIRGIVQGVGFRPFVYRLALRLGVHGFVKNQTGSVWIEVEGDADALNRFLSELAHRGPPLAQIQHLSWEARPSRGDAEFRIETSAADAPESIYISPDVATCDDCLAELFDPRDRRFGYPFLNCTNCGPRLTIITGVPYDRARTTMAAFPLCAACRREYEDPADRRFHAQPIACPACGPRLKLLDAAGEEIEPPQKGPARRGEPIWMLVAALRTGKIAAVKGIGGYHLVCDAGNGEAVAALRRRKRRDEKPFAVMVQDAAAAERYCAVGPLERELLESPRRPIVLLRKRADNGIASEVAPDNPWLGVMLPYAPLHHLLLRAMAGVPLVMTSGNRSDEPIAYRDEEAVANLGGIADLFLVHDRPIHVRCDDSVTRVVDGMELPMRRSRGYAPRPIALPVECPVPMVAVGGQLKGAFALGRGKEAFLSHHLGDLDHYEAFRAFERDLELYRRLFSLEPVCVVHDLHPDYASTRYARAWAEKTGIRLLAVQHHLAHVASCMAEHGLSGPVIGVSFDGTGCGSDGAVWGGEFIVGDCSSLRRVGHLRYVGMPGGEQAIREPWRMALAHLFDAGLTHEPLTARFLQREIHAIQRMLERGFNTPLTSSAGRLFDAVASLAGVRHRVSYEGQAAIQLEWLASRHAPAGAYPFQIEEPRDPATDSSFVIDTRPVIEGVAADASRQVDAGLIARRFHSTLAEVIVTVCKKLAQANRLDGVVLSGGVFQNALLTSEVSAGLGNAGLRIYRHRIVPPNDGGLCLGQLMIAACSPDRNA